MASQYTDIFRVELPIATVEAIVFEGNWALSTAGVVATDAHGDVARSVTCSPTSLDTCEPDTDFLLHETQRRLTMRCSEPLGLPIDDHCIAYS